MIISATDVSAGSAIAQASATPKPSVPWMTGTDLYTKLWTGFAMFKKSVFLLTYGTEIVYMCPDHEFNE